MSERKLARTMRGFMDRDYTVQYLADYMDRDPTQIKRTLSGEKLPTPEYLWEVAEALASCPERHRATGRTATKIYRILMAALSEDARDEARRNRIRNDDKRNGGG